MIINGQKLYDASPVSPMAGMKLREHGVSYGLAEAGYDLRIKQAVTLHPFRRFALAIARDHREIIEHRHQEWLEACADRIAACLEMEAAGC